MLLFQTKREVPVTCTLYCSGWTRRTDQRTRPKNCGLPAARSNHPFTTSFKKRNAVCLCGMTPWPTNPWIQNKTQWFEMTPPPHLLHFLPLPQSATLCCDARWPASTPKPLASVCSVYCGVSWPLTPPLPIYVRLLAMCDTCPAARPRSQNGRTIDR